MKYISQPKTGTASVVDVLKAQMTEIAKRKAAGQDAGKGVDTTNFMRQFRDSDSLELKKLSAAQFMDVWEHYDTDGKIKLLLLFHVFWP